MFILLQDQSCPQLKNLQEITLVISVRTIITLTALLFLELYCNVLSIETTQKTVFCMRNGFNADPDPAF
jgi:hypothetical protein